MNGKTTGSSTQTQLVDIEWVAGRLGVKVRHVRRLVADRRIPFVKWGHLAALRPGRDRSVDRVPSAAGGLRESVDYR